MPGDIWAGLGWAGLGWAGRRGGWLVIASRGAIGGVNVDSISVVLLFELRQLAVSPSVKVQLYATPSLRGRFLNSRLVGIVEQ
jgi:hypothetical protein